jgi:putative FmdB family regulatory protein
MDVYEYLCPKCGSQFELMRLVSEAEKPAKCPKRSSEAQKLLSSYIHTELNVCALPCSHRTQPKMSNLARRSAE